MRYILEFKDEAVLENVTAVRQVAREPGISESPCEVGSTRPSRRTTNSER